MTLKSYLKVRESLFDHIKEQCLCYAIRSASEAEIDEFNILNANFLAMRRALSAIGVSGLDVFPRKSCRIQRKAF